jgi:hypothetical protein
MKPLSNAAQVDAVKPGFYRITDAVGLYLAKNEGGVLVAVRLSRLSEGHRSLLAPIRRSETTSWTLY